MAAAGGAMTSEGTSTIALPDLGAALALVVMLAAVLRDAVRSG
jgi:hypothetical protein